MNADERLVLRPSPRHVSTLVTVAAVVGGICIALSIWSFALAPSGVGAIVALVLLAWYVVVPGLYFALASFFVTPTEVGKTNLLGQAFTVARDQVGDIELRQVGRRTRKLCVLDKHGEMLFNSYDTGWTNADADKLRKALNLAG